MRRSYSVSLTFLLAACSTLAFTGCATAPPQQPPRITAFTPVERPPRPTYQPDPIPAVPPVHSRYATPGTEGVVLDQPATPPATPPTETTVQGLASGCNPLHYLLDRTGSDDTVGIDNRFSWFEKQAPASGPLRPPPTTDINVARNSLLCHFHPGLARVVGQSSTRITDAGFKLLSWDDAAITNPNALAELEFIFRPLRPYSAPAVRTLRTTGTSMERVLVNDTAAGASLDIDGERLRPSLWIDFAKPQRAVAVEVGVPRDAGQTIHQAGMKLIAYDRNGRILRIARPDGSATDLRSDGRAFGSDTNIVLGDFGNVVGVQDREGRIYGIELRFDYVNADALDDGGDPGEKIRAPQVVRRLWHEPLPPAAVRQGSVGLTTHVPPTNPPANTIPSLTFEEKFGKAPGPETINLPFRLDRALVMVRGVRWEFAGVAPRPLTEMSAGIGPVGILARDRNELRDANGVTSLNRRQVTLTPTGRFVAEPGTTHPFHLVVDYSLLAWDSEQVELYGTSVSVGTSGANEDVALTRISTADPCPFSASSISVAQRQQVCGPLFGAPQSFSLLMNPEQEIDRIDFVVGSVGGFASRQGLTLRRDNAGNQPVVIWEQAFHFEGSDDNPHRLSFSGTVLTGPSLRIGPDRLVPAGQPHPHAVRFAYGDIPTSFPMANTGPRADRTDFGFQPGVHRDWGIAWPMYADVAVVALDQFFTEPGDPLQQLDIEVKGDSYQGVVVDWKTGLGINADPPIIGGLDPDRNRFIAATAQFGGASRVSPFSTGFATKRDLAFESGVAGLTQRGVDVSGLLGNPGPDAVWIDNVIRGTQPQDSYFALRYLIPRHPMERRGMASLGVINVDENGLRDRLPLLLRPGERIEIIGAYTPGEATSFLPHIGSTEFRLRSGGVSRSTRVLVAGSAIEASPGGEWRPGELVFTAAPANPPQALVAMLVTTGSTPLALTRLFLENTNLGYRFERLPQIEPEVLGIRVTCGDASAVCTGQTRLIAETNAGNLPLVLRMQ